MLQPLANKAPNFGEFKYEIPKIPSAKASSSKTSSPTYASVGDPTYDKKMDSDNDGTITFDEFNQYCDENNISDAQKQRMLEDRMHWETIKQSLIYSEKGELKYNEDMDANKDNKVSYDEYVEYIRGKREENKQNTEEVKVNSTTEQNENNLAKQLSAYSSKEKPEDDSNIEVEA